jgi:ribosomal protein L4
LMVEGVNVYDLMRTQYLVSTRKGIEAIQNRLIKANA